MNTKPSSKTIIPKLRKNRNIESKWGTQYKLAAQYILFGKQCFPHMPTETPASLSEQVVESEPLYTCKQCKDCFRFQNSFDDHIKRRSWILGFWCHNCFKTVCTHINKSDFTCSICAKKDIEKRSYLRKRGLIKTKNQKLGAMRVFYNQCQLFEHMKMHNLDTIYMGDIMLMPLPINVSNSDWSPELEITCEALMEYTFLLRVHIMDWLKINKVEDTWWKPVNNKNENNDDLVNKIVKGYQGRQLFKICEKSIDNQNASSSNTHNVSKNSFNMEFIEFDFKDKDKNYFMNAISDKNVLENEDNPCMSNDIAFVDCGPISNCFETEPPVNYSPKKQVKINKSIQDTANVRLSNVAERSNKRKHIVLTNYFNLLETKNTCENITNVVKNNGKNSSEYFKQAKAKDSTRYKIIQPFVKKTVGDSIDKSIIETSVEKIVDNSVKINVPFSAKRIKLHKTNSNRSEQTLQKSITNGNSNIITVKGPENVNIESIIKNIPPHLISNKKFVLLERDSRKVITVPTKNNTTEKKTSKSILRNIDASPQNKMCDSVVTKKQQTSNKIIIRNGKRYLVKHSGIVTKNSRNSSNLSILSNGSKTVNSPTTEHDTLNSSSEVENIAKEQTNLFHNNVPTLTPSPSPSELSSGSSCESHVKQTLTMKSRKVPPQLISLSSTQKNLFETISLVKEKNDDFFMKIKRLDHIPQKMSRDTCDAIPKQRQNMIDEFYQLNSFELKKRIDHLQRVSEEMAKVMNFMSEDVLKEKLRSISILQRILEECFHKCDQDVKVTKDDDTLLNKWESEMKKINTCCKCRSCNKIVKPKSYITGFSKLPKDDNAYCICYKHVCHECLSYHGTLSRFIAHQNFHKKAKPYVCPDCRCKFSSFKFLEIHMWTVCFHTLKKRVFVCKICEIDGFRDMESIARHFAIMHSITKITCEYCYKVFSTYGEYIKHYTETHPSVSKQNPIRLVVCKLSGEILRCENYIPYLEAYPGIRKLAWFKCPFCPMITLENKHMAAELNTHLQDKHFNRLSEILGKESLVHIFGEKFLRTNLAEDFACEFVNTNNASNEDGTVIPKIVNTRTITSEIFERGSQNIDDIWTVNPDSSISSVKVNSKMAKGADDREKTESPKILDVRSMVDLEVSRSKTEKRNSRKSEIEVIKGKTENSSGEYVQVVTVESNDNLSGSKTRTEKTKESDTNGSLANPVIESSESISVLTRKNTNGRIKVVDIRKICKSNVEPLVAVESRDTQPENKNTSQATSVLKPPPLARIPTHLLESIKAAEPPVKSKNIAKSKSLTRKADKQKLRISINGPTDKQEECIEFLCHLCGERINTSWSVIRTHFSEKHPQECRLAIVAPQLLRLSPDFIKDGYKQIIGSKKRKSDVVLFSSKRRRRWTTKKHTETKDLSTSDTGLCVEQETAEDGEGNFKCKKCDQRCGDMSALREHIAATHRLKGRYLICLECGENFVVAPSLQMHLKAFHGIEDPICYMSQNPSYAPDVDDLQAEKTTIANQCYVCMAVFEDKAAVDKHLRVHGMAFLNRKRIEARNALKSPEKQINVEENKPSPTDESPKKQVPVKRDRPAESILEKLNATACHGQNERNVEGINVIK